MIKSKTKSQTLHVPSFHLGTLSNEELSSHGLRQNEKTARALRSTGFLSLPHKIRIEIYKNVLVVAHPLYLFQDSSSQKVESFAPEKPAQWLAILCINRHIHDEASIILYSSNMFTFMDTSHRQIILLQSFFNCIGSSNAAHLSHLSINFPVVANTTTGESGETMLSGDDLCSLKLLKENCTGLTTLETLLYGEKHKYLLVASENDSYVIQEALLQVDLQLKGISSVKKVIVKYYNGTPSTLVLNLMQGYGWVVLRGR